MSDAKIPRAALAALLAMVAADAKTRQRALQNLRDPYYR